MKERGMKGIFFLAAAIAALALILISIFLFASGVPAIFKIGISNFLFGTVWRPGNQVFGILPMILGSIWVTVGAMLIGVPIALLMAVFLAYFCPPGLYRFCKSGVQLMAGIPSIIYGFFGMVVLVPLVKQIFGVANGNTMLTASILLGIMILPTVAGVAESALASVPKSYYEGALALGASHSQSVYTVIVPAAKSGLKAGIVLGIGRAIGETMAVIMVAGNQARMPVSAVSGVRTMTANIVLEMGYASGLHREALVGVGVVLFFFILIVNLSIAVINRRANHEA